MTLRHCAGGYGFALELTHNHGTEAQEGFKYHDGQSEPRGFVHMGFSVLNKWEETLGRLEDAGVTL